MSAVAEDAETHPVQDIHAESQPRGTNHEDMEFQSPEVSIYRP